MSEHDVDPPSQPAPERVRVRVRKRRRVKSSGDSHHQRHHHGSHSAHRRSRHRGLRIGAAVVATFVVLIAVFGAIGGIAGYRNAQALEGQVAAQFASGKADLESGKTLLSQATSQRSPTELAAAEAKFTSARAHFQAAAQRAHSSRLVREGQGLPVLGPYLAPRIAAIDHLSVAGSSLAQVALGAAQIDTKLIAPASGASAPAQLVDALESSTPYLNQIQANLGDAQRALNRVQPAVLPAGDRATVKQLKTIVGGGVTGVAQLQTLLPVLVQMLGMNGAQTYLVEQVNPAELRAGGGFIGSFSIMQADQGNMTVPLSEGTYVTDDDPRLQPGQAGYVTPPGPLQQFTNDQSWILGDSNFDPSFVQDSQAGMYLLQHETGIQVQGVISIDPDAIADLLKITGPQQVPDWNVTIDASNFANYIFQFEDSSNAPANKKSFFGEAAVPIISALTRLPASRWPDLISVLNQAATQRDLQAYFTNPQLEAEMDRIGWSGTINPDAAPNFLLDSESNFGSTKANHFVQRTYHVDLSANGNELVHKVTVDLKNSAPSGYEGGQDYKAYVRVYVPSNATNFSVGNLTRDEIADTAAPPAGLQMKDGWILVGVDQQLGYGTGAYTFQYDTPYDGSTQQIYWQKEPGTAGDAIDLSWSVAGQTYTASTTLTQDKLVTLTSGGLTVTNGHAATAELPSLGF